MHLNAFLVLQYLVFVPVRTPPRRLYFKAYNKWWMHLYHCLIEREMRTITVHATIPEKNWAGIIRKLIAAHNALDASHSLKSRSGIVAYTVVLILLILL